MSIADELARERATKRRGEARDVNEARGIDDLDSLEHLDTLDWTTDPWDDADAAGTVERLRWQTRSVKWVAYTLLVIVIALILVAGLAGWWYVRQINPPGDAGEPVSFTVDPADTLQTLERAPGGRGAHRRRRRVPLVRRAPRRPGDHTRLLRAGPQRPHGQRPRPAAHAARADLHQGDVPGGLHGGPDRGAHRPRHGDDDRGRLPRRRRRSGGRRQPAPARRDVARGPAVPRHLPGVQRRERGPGRGPDDRPDGAGGQPGGHRRQGRTAGRRARTPS